MPQTMPAKAQDRGAQASAPQREKPSLADAAAKRGHALSRKAALLMDATQNFCAIGRPERKDIEVYRELFYSLIGGCSRIERRQLAVAISRNAYAPRPIMFYLALETPDVAAPVLLFSQALNEADILTLCGRLPMEHLKILCRRLDLSEASVLALKSAGGPECAAILMRNPSVVQQHRKRKKASYRPDRLTAAPPAVRAHRSQEAETPRGAKAAEKAMAKAKAPERAVAKAKAPDEPNKAEIMEKPAEKAEMTETKEPARAARAMTREAMREQLVDLAGRGGRLGRTEKGATAPAPARETPESLERQLIAAARDQGIDAVARLIAQASGMPSTTAARVVGARQSEILCVLFKGLGIGLAAALQLMLLLDRNLGKSREAYEAAKALFNRIDADDCRSLIGSLGGRPQNGASEWTAAPQTPPEPATTPGGAGGAPVDWRNAVASRRKEISGPAQTRRPPPRRKFGLRDAG